MPRITVNIARFKGNKFVREQIVSIRSLSERHLEEIARETARVIKQKIQERIERAGSTGNLANSMFAFPLEDGWGVGDINYLNKQAPYWYWCLKEDTEVYVLFEDKIIPMTLVDLYKNRHKVKKILTPYGLKEINNVWETFPEDKYDIYLTNYMKITASGNHIFPCKLNGKILEKKVRNLPNKSINSYNMLYSSLNSVNNEELIDSVAINGKSINLDFDLGFVLGFILGDGWVGKNRTCIAQKQLDTGSMINILKRFCKKFDYNPRIYKQINEKSYIHRIEINNNEICGIINHFIKGTSYKKRLTNVFLNSNKQFRVGILEGYKYSDGRKEQKSGDNIRSISKSIVNDLLIIASSLGHDISELKNQKINCSPKSFKSVFNIFSGSYYYLSRTHHNERGFKFTNVREINKDREKRNEKGQWVYEKYEVPEFNVRPKMIKNVIKIEDNPRFFDINVEGNLFIINKGIVSHNSNYGVAQSGRKVPPPSKGFFSPGNPKPSAGGGSSRWNQSSDGPFLIRPTKPITPKNYIQATVNEINSIVSSVIKRVK